MVIERGWYGARRWVGALVLCGWLAGGCGGAPDADAATDQGSELPGTSDVVIEERSTEYVTIRVTRMVSMDDPWAIAFLPDGDLLVTRRSGAMVRVRDGEGIPVEGVPSPHVQNQGGLLDVALHPDFEDGGWVYWTWSRGDSEGTVPALSRGRLEGTTLSDVELVFESNTRTSPGRHYGSRILFLPDGTLLMTIGDRGAQPGRAQEPSDHSGTVVRLNDDGSVPPDNPFIGDDAVQPEIWSMGHRNIQGIVRDPETGAIWATEHGPRGGDELNLLAPGRNYGWPIASLGRDYRTQEAFGQTRDFEAVGMTPPVWEFLPTLAPSGLARVSGERFGPWEGDLLAGGLRAERILRLVVENERVVHIEELLAGDLGRIRDVREGPGGSIFVAVEGDEGGIFRIDPED